MFFKKIYKNNTFFLRKCAEYRMIVPRAICIDGFYGPWPNGSKPNISGNKPDNVVSFFFDCLQKKACVRFCYFYGMETNDVVRTAHDNNKIKPPIYTTHLFCNSCKLSTAQSGIQIGRASCR